MVFVHANSITPYNKNVILFVRTILLIPPKPACEDMDPWEPTITVWKALEGKTHTRSGRRHPQAVSQHRIHATRAHIDPMPVALETDK